MKHSSGALADSKPEREAWLGAASGTSRAAVRWPSPSLSHQAQTDPSVKHPLSTVPSPKQQVETQPQTDRS